jgi:hypothetical protein
LRSATGWASRRNRSGFYTIPSTRAGRTVTHRAQTLRFGGAATWPNVLAFEKILEQGLIVNDGSFGWVTDPTVRDKWQQIPKVATYPEFLWSQPDDDPTFGRVNGRRAISSTQVPAGQVIFAKWSEMLISSWVGVEILVDPPSAHHRIAAPSKDRASSVLVSQLRRYVPTILASHLVVI